MSNMEDLKRQLDAAAKIEAELLGENSANSTDGSARSQDKIVGEEGAVKEFFDLIRKEQEDIKVK